MFAVFVDSHLHFLVLLEQDLGAFQCKDALFALAEVHGVVRAVRQNKVIPVFVPVVFIVVPADLPCQSAGYDICLRFLYIWSSGRP